MLLLQVLPLLFQILLEILSWTIFLLVFQDSFLRESRRRPSDPSRDTCFLSGLVPGLFWRLWTSRGQRCLRDELLLSYFQVPCVAFSLLSFDASGPLRVYAQTPFFCSTARNAGDSLFLLKQVILQALPCTRLAVMGQALKARHSLTASLSRD